MAATHPVQVVARHGGEQVVLDLVVQAAHEPAHQPAALHVAGGSDLQTEEVRLVIRIVHRHA